MALSTTIPTAKQSPAREITFKLRPVSTMITKVPMTDMGMATAIMIVGHMLRKKSRSTMTARHPPSIRFLRTSSKAL